jgi:hypothetical protein
MGALAWVKVLAQNRKTIFGVIKDGFSDWRNGSKKNRTIPAIADPSPDGLLDDQGSSASPIPQPVTSEVIPE